MTFQTVRRVRSQVQGAVTSTADLVFSMAVSSDYQCRDESFIATLDGAPLKVTEIQAPSCGRLHRIEGVPAGSLDVRYQTTVDGVVAPLLATPLELLEFGRPSRYCDSDRLAPVAAAHFAGQTGLALMNEVARWVHDSLSYVSGSSRPVDGAVDTFLAREGICRDFAHLVVAILRARNVPARLVSVYAPGLSPMDFHAVAEAHLDGRWQVIDATGLAPRQSIVRIATGRDAADTAFLTVTRGTMNFGSMTVEAVIDGRLPIDDPGQLAYIS